MNKILPFILLLLTTIGCNKNAPEVELVLDTKSALGEGAIWNHITQKLYWVDIEGKILNIYNPSLGVNKELRTGQMIGTVVPSEPNNVIVALENGFYSMDIKTGAKEFIVNPEQDKPGNRFNDGKCDPAGRFWAGTMKRDGSGKNGALYKLDIKGEVSRMINGVGISNGIAWSPCHNKMYYIDTPTQSITMYKYNYETGEISNPEVVVKVPREMGSPDGMTIDSEGNLWVALWGGSAVACWNPANGKLVQKIDIPAKNVTSCAFGGPGFKTLYITTARIGTSELELGQYPHSGGVFKTKPGVAGMPAYFFKGIL